MDKLDKLPEGVKKGLIEFLSDIPVEKYSEQWRAIQVAIAMITTPQSFKQNVHVYLTSHEGGHEEGYFNVQAMSVKIWPHKIQMKRTHREWSSWAGLTQNELHRYIFPSEKYGVWHFNELMSDTSDLFETNYSMDSSDVSGVCYCSANFSIETNAK